LLVALLGEARRSRFILRGLRAYFL